MRLKDTILILLFSFIVTNVNSQIFNFRVYGLDEGLPQSYVYSITQTDAGFINVSTGEGFSSFEGSKFHNFTIKDNLSENFVTTHFTDSRKITWLGHYQKGISYEVNGKFFQLTQSNTLASKITAITEDKQKNVWFSTQNKGLFKIDTTFKMTTMRSEGEDGSNVVCFDETGLLLEGAGNGLFVYQIDKTGKRLATIQTIEALSGKVVKCIVPINNQRNSFWVAVDDEGIFGIKKVGDRYQIFTSFKNELLLKDYNITSLYVDQKQNLWAGDFGEGLRKISFYDSKKAGSFKVSKIDNRNGLPNEYIQSIFEDYEGNMWFGSFGSGLIELPLEKFAFFEEKNGLIYKNATSVFIDEEGLFWVGNDKGLFQYNIEYPELSKQYNVKDGFINAEVSSIAQDRSGLLWIGTHENGVYTFDKKKKKFENFSKKKNITCRNINSIISTHDNVIVIATTEGVYFYDQTKNSIEHLTTLDGLLHNNVIKIFEDSKRRIWFCSNGAGPYYLKNNEFNVFNNIPEMHSFSITCITQSVDGNIWLGTDGDGVFKYSDQGGFVNYKVSEGLFSNYCYFIIADKNGNIWSGHKNGISYKPHNLKSFRTYSKTDGLLFTDFNRNSCLMDVAGNLWLGTSNGLIKYNAEGENRIESEPKTNIASLILNKSAYGPSQIIEVPYDDYAVKVDFNAISFTDPAKVNFKYRLLGQDTIWRYTNAKFMEFPKLNDGEYKFQLLAANSDNIWNKVPAEISFIIKPPYWKRVWFYAVVLILTISISYSVTKYHTKSLTLAKLVLENRVNEKTSALQVEKAIVEKIKVELEVKNKNVIDSINYAQRIQESILPSKTSISDVFNQSFVYYQPKDIVSGDFYWFSETPDDYLIAAVDCTGHGVPGAFMSLVGSTLLNELVHKKITKPSTILTKLNSAVIKVLHQKKVDVNTSHDGMDMAICSISKDKSKLNFSGALRPLYHVRNNQLTEIKGSRYFIGGYYENLYKTFEDTEIDLLPGDMIYIFSDGYADQFAEHNKKKFSTKRFKTLLTEISTFESEEQCRILKEQFTSWKGKDEQIDDVMVIGIKF